MSSDITHLWRDEHDTAFASIIEALTTEPVLGIADKTLPFTLHCDASGTGLGAVLYQEQEGTQKVIAYASRGLNRSEANYPAHKREFLALKWAMTDKFHDYLYGSHVTVVTDNNPLCYVLKNAKLDATGHRWLASLSLYDFELKYRKGSIHTDADTLSRLHGEPPTEDEDYQKLLQQTQFLMEKAKQFEAEKDTMTFVDRETVCALLQAKGVVGCQRQAVEVGNEEVDNFIPAAEQLLTEPGLLDDGTLDPVSGTPTLSAEEWVKFQGADPMIKQVVRCLQDGRALDLHLKKNKDPELRVYAREASKLKLKEGVLYRVVHGEEDTVTWQLVVPKSHRQQAMKGVHEDLFHVHLDSALRQARLRFFWPYMARDLERKISKCRRCLQRGAPRQKAPMSTIETTFPLELLSIDYLTIEEKGSKVNLLVVMDHFTKFAQAIVTRDQTAKCVAKALWENFFMVYGFPSRILSDQGRDFQSKLIKEVCQLAGIEKCRTTPYHPCGNPVERWNRSLIQMLRSLDVEQKPEWRKHLKAVVHAYNSRIHESTGYSPYYLFFGRHPRLPVDLAFGIELGKGIESPRQYIQKLKSSLQSAYGKAKAMMEKTALKNKARFDAGAYAADLEVGDRVLVRKMGPQIKSKVDDRWEENIYRVIAKKEGVPVYTVKPEVGDGPIRTLHRNLLLPIGWLDASSASETGRSTGDAAPRARPRRRADPVDEDGTPQEVELSLELTLPRVQLRPRAQEFVSKSSDKSQNGELEPQSTNAEGVEELAAESVVGEGDSEPLGVEIERGLSEVEPQMLEPCNSSQESFSKKRQVSRPVPAPRRSRRQRKPVERLNLVQVVDLELLENVRQKLSILVEGKKPVPAYMVIEDVLRCFLNLFDSA